MELFTRYDANPILEASGWPGEVNSVFNPAAVEVDGETILLVRVEDRTGISHLGVARSADGLTGWTIEPERALLPDLGSEEERFGIEDPRVTRVGEEWFILFTGYSVGGPLVLLATTRDFRSYERRGVVLPPRDKDAALFPDRVGGRYAPAPPPDGRPRRRGSRDLDRVERRPAQLGRPRPRPPARGGRLLGVAQDRGRAATAPHRRRLARPLPRRPPDRVRVDLPRRARPARPRPAGTGHRPVPRVGLRPPGSVRAGRRRRERRLPVRLDRSGTTGTRCASTTARPTPASAWRPRASRPCSTICANRGSQRPRRRSPSSDAPTSGSRAAAGRRPRPR